MRNRTTLNVAPDTRIMATINVTVRSLLNIKNVNDIIIEGAYTGYAALYA
jgi:hypothetical protein